MSYNSSANPDVTRTRINAVVAAERAKKRRAKAKESKKRKGFKLRFSTKLKALGETDFKKRTVTINRKWHKLGNKHRPSKTRKIPEILKTRVHEADHVRHPKMTEHAVQKKTNKQLKKLSRKQKKKIYNRTIIYKH